MSLLNGQALISQALYGINNTYSLLAQNSSGGLSLKDITNPSDEKKQQLGYNTSFSQFLANNFSAMDRDGDGKITQQDVSDLTEKMAQHGLSYNEIVQLCSTGGGNSTLMNTVLTYFSKIDKNGDGRVTNAEIQSFGIEAEEEKMKTKYKSFKSSDMTVFYGNDDSSSEEPSSLIDNLYPSDEA